LLGYFTCIPVSEALISGCTVPPDETHLKCSSVEPKRAGATIVTVSRNENTSRPFLLQNVCAFCRRAKNESDEAYEARKAERQNL